MRTAKTRGQSENSSQLEDVEALETCVFALTTTVGHAKQLRREIKANWCGAAEHSRTKAAFPIHVYGTSCDSKCSARLRQALVKHAAR
jgi:hypothetical protein